MSGGWFGSNTLRALQTIIHEYPQWLPLIYELCWQLFGWYQKYEIFNQTRYYDVNGFTEVPEATVTSPKQLLELYELLKTNRYHDRFLHHNKERFKYLIREISELITRGYDPSNSILYLHRNGQKFVTKEEYFMHIKPKLIKEHADDVYAHLKRNEPGSRFIPHHP
jgi:hypothetical protein